MEAIGLIAAIGASALVIEKVVSFIRRAFDAGNRVKTEGLPAEAHGTPPQLVLPTSRLPP